VIWSIPFFLPIYAICFAAMFALHRWYLLLPGVAAACFFLAWLLAGMTGADGPETIGIAMIAFPSGLGFASGFIGRLIVMLVGHFTKSWISTLTIGAASFVAVPAFAMLIFHISEARRMARYAPPSEQCLANPRPAVLGAVALDLPPGAPISVIIGHGTEDPSANGYKPIRSLAGNIGARQFCAETEGSTPKLSQLSIDFLNSDTAAGFCERASGFAWRDRACSRAQYGGRSDFPEKASFYAIGEYNARRMLAFDPDDRREIDRLESSGGGDRLGGGVTRYGDPHYTYLIKRMQQGEQPILAQCYKTSVREVPGPDGLYCVTGFRISNSVGAVAHFRASQATAVEDWLNGIGGTKAIWESLRRKN
jgi:hypothetical protein